MKRLILCADDFAFSTDVSTTIVELLRAGKLNATSCMTVRPNWMADTAMLRDVPTGAEIGLHLVLTEERPLLGSRLATGGVLPSIERLRALARTGKLVAKELAAEIHAQFDAFEQAMERPPAFIDAHQHAHVLPIVREIVLEITRLRASDAWVRVCDDRLVAMIARPFAGKAIGSAFHSRGMRRDIARFGLRSNTSFAGHYDFKSNYADLFPRFLRSAGGAHLVMCHPGAGARNGDRIAQARTAEAAALRRLPIGAIAASRGLAFSA